MARGQLHAARRRQEFFNPRILDVVSSPKPSQDPRPWGPLAREQRESGVILIQLIGMIACYPGLLGLIWQAWGSAGARSSKMGVISGKMGVRETHESVTNAHQGASGVSAPARTTRTAGGVSRCRATGGLWESGPEPPGQASSAWEPWSPSPCPMVGEA